MTLADHFPPPAFLMVGFHSAFPDARVWRPAHGMAIRGELADGTGIVFAEGFPTVVDREGFIRVIAPCPVFVAMTVPRVLLVGVIHAGDPFNGSVFACRWAKGEYDVHGAATIARSDLVGPYTEFAIAKAVRLAAEEEA